MKMPSIAHDSEKGRQFIDDILKLIVLLLLTHCRAIFIMKYRRKRRWAPPIMPSIASSLYLTNQHKAISNSLRFKRHPLWPCSDSGEKYIKCPRARVQSAVASNYISKRFEGFSIVSIF